MNNFIKRVSWILYDAINSLVIIVGAVYFTKWMIVDAGVSDTVVAVSVSLASVFFIFIAPYFGSRLQTEKTVWKSLLFTTIMVGVLATILGLPGIKNPPSDVLLYGAIFAFFLLNIFYQMSLVAYNAYLPRLVNYNSLQRYSGFGEASGQLGSVLGIFLAIGLLSISWFEIATVRIFFVLGPLALILSVLVVILLRKPVVSEYQEDLIVSSEDHPRRPLKELLNSQYFFGLILVIFLYNNAFVTLQVFSGSYLSLAAGWDEKTIGLGIAGTLIGAAVGALTVGLLKRTVSIGMLLVTGLTVFAISISGLVLLWSKAQILLSLFGGGIGFGMLAATSRICIVILAKGFSQGEKFGVYAAVSRTSAIIGPLLWAVALAISSNLDDIGSRQVGMATLASMIWLGLLIALIYKLHRIDIKE